MDAAERLRTSILSNGFDQESDEESHDGTEPHTAYGDIPDEDRVLTKRILSRFLSSKDDDTIYSQGKARIFAFLCDVLEIDYTHIDLARKSAKRFLYDCILDVVGTATYTTFEFLFITYTFILDDDEPC